MALFTHDNDQLLLGNATCMHLFLYIRPSTFTVTWYCTKKEVNLLFLKLMFVSPNYRCMHVQNDFFFYKRNISFEILFDFKVLHLTYLSL